MCVTVVVHSQAGGIVLVVCVFEQLKCNRLRAKLYIGAASGAGARLQAGYTPCSRSHPGLCFRAVLNRQHQPGKHQEHATPSSSVLDPANTSILLPANHTKALPMVSRWGFSQQRSSCLVWNAYGSHVPVSRSREAQNATTVFVFFFRIREISPH